MQTLRDFQLVGADAVMAEFAKGVKSTCVVWATGLGKSTLASEIVRRFLPRQVLFVCERKQLINQAAERIEQHTGIRCAIERGEFRVSPGLLDPGQPIVASIQSLNSAWGLGKRMQKFKPSLVIVDEFHHSTAPQYERLFSYTSDSFKLGLSATPKRLDGKALGKHFDTVAHHFELKEAIEAGWLCDIAQEFIRVQGLDYSKIRTVRGDLDKNQLANVMEAENIVQRICQPSLEILFGVERGALSPLTPDKWSVFLDANGHQPFHAIMFCVTVKHAELAAEVLNRGYPGIARMICNKTSEDDRKIMFRDFRAGKFSVLTNCGVLGEGVDLPETTVILQCRPTKSLSLWIQQLGRGTRTLPGTIDGLDTPALRRDAIAKSQKPFVRVVDFVGNSGRHKLISSIDVLGGNYSEDVRALALSDAIKRGKPVKMTAVLVNTDNQRKKELEEAKKRGEQQAKRHLVAGVEYLSRKINPFDKSPNPDFWASPKKSQGEPATESQCKVIGRAGINPSGLTKKQASMIIGIIAKNNWRLPLDPKYDWIRNRGRRAA